MRHPEEVQSWLLRRSLISCYRITRTCSTFKLELASILSLFGILVQIRNDAFVSAEYNLENTRKFVSAVEQIGLPGFNVSDLLQVIDHTISAFPFVALQI